MSIVGNKYRYNGGKFKTVDILGERWTSEYLIYDVIYYGEHTQTASEWKSIIENDISLRRMTLVGKVDEVEMAKYLLTLDIQQHVV